MIIKTIAIPLQISPFTESSQIVTWLTQDHGKISTLIKGAKRPKSFFLGQYDHFYTCELVFLNRGDQHLSLANECYPLKLRPELRTAWRSAAIASYFISITDHANPFHAIHPTIFQLLDSSLDSLIKQKPTLTSIFHFELKLLEDLGFSPRLQHCLSCQKSLVPSPELSYFSPQDGGLVCQNCANQNQGYALRISADILAILGSWQRAMDVQTIRNIRCSERQLSTINSLLHSFLGYHLESELASRTIALEIFCRGQPR